MIFVKSVSFKDVADQGQEFAGSKKSLQQYPSVWSDEIRLNKIAMTRWKGKEMSEDEKRSRIRGGSRSQPLGMIFAAICGYLSFKQSGQMP